MKKLNTMPLYLSLLMAALLPYMTQAASNKEKKVDAKCYVEITGGIKTISFWSTSPKKIKELSRSIHGKKIVASYAGKKHAVIDKVYECVLSNDRFSSLAANNVDRKTPR